MTLIELDSSATKTSEGGTVAIEINANPPLFGIKQKVVGKFSGEVSVNDVAGSASLTFVYNTFNVEAKATRNTVGSNGKKITFELSGSHVPTSKLNVEYSAARITDSKLEVSVEVDNHLTASWKCGIVGRKISCQADFKGKGSQSAIISQRELCFVAALDLNMSQFQSTISWTNAQGEDKKDVKLTVQFNKNDNKLTMKFNSPFAQLQNVELDGLKESTANGAIFKGTAKVNNDPATIDVEYSLMMDTPVKEFEATLKGTRGNKFINVAYKSKVDLAEKEVKGSLVVTGSEFKETSIQFEAEYGKNRFFFKFQLMIFHEYVLAQKRREISIVFIIQKEEKN